MNAVREAPLYSRSRDNACGPTAKPHAQPPILLNTFFDFTRHSPVYICGNSKEGIKYLPDSFLRMSIIA